MNNETIAHRWAQNDGTDYGNSRYNNVFSYGESIYSYGTHFIIAKHINDKRDKAHGVYDIYFTLDSYSSTTSKHVHHVRMATSHLKALYVYEIPQDNKYMSNSEYNDYLKQVHAKNICHFVKKAKEYLKLASRARRRKAMYMDRFNHSIERAQELKDLFKISQKAINNAGQRGGFGKTWNIWQALLADDAEAQLVKELDKESKALQKERAEQARQDEQERARRALQLEKDKAEAQGKFEAWRQGGSSMKFHLVSSYHDFTRVHNGKIETSKGIRAEVNDYLDLMKLLELAKGGKDIAGSRVAEHYKVSRVDLIGESVQINCHVFTFDELHRLGQEIKAKGLCS